jgi:hypothetical protein
MSIININNKCYVHLTGGLGNQMFMILNGLSLSLKFNMCINFFYDKDYISYYLKKGIQRKDVYEYNFFKSLNFEDIDESIVNEINIFKELEFKFNSIQSLENKTLIKGYFQSYKYFWDYKEKIKDHINIDKEIIKEILNKYKKFNKKILSIHIRLGDYESLQDYHHIVSLKYLKKALSIYNLEDYQIIIFSDNIESAKNKVSPLNLNFVEGNKLFNNDEYQFYMLMLSDVVIGSSSTFSLVACYFNEIYKFKSAEYVFPDKWFGLNGPDYDIYDLIPINNNNFKIINTEEETYGIFLIATGKYIKYLDTIIPSIKEKLLTQNKKILFITTDNIPYLDKFKKLLDNNYHIITNYQNCRGFPADTMYRFEYFLNFKKKILILEKL